jgi:hypothetical protein
MPGRPFSPRKPGYPSRPEKKIVDHTNNTLKNFFSIILPGKPGVPRGPGKPCNNMMKNNISAS